MAYQILVVDDEPSLRAMVTDLLQRQGYNVTQAASCAQARQAWADARPDAVLLDVMLPDGDGFSLLGELRRQGDIPVLFLSARDEDEARLRGLGLGADDYITKPFLPQELLLRLAAVLRRVYGAPAEEILCLGPVTIRWGSGLVERPDGTVSLTAALWEGTLVGYENTLMVHIRRLREKIELDPSHPRYLLTVRGLGYRLLQEAAL